MSEIFQVLKKFGIDGPSNWQLVAFGLIAKVVKGRSKTSHFYRTELFTQTNLDHAIDWLQKIGHRKNPKNPEETLQRTIQNMRDVGYIDFLGRGEYRLTEKGNGMIEKYEDFFKTFHL